MKKFFEFFKKNRVRKILAAAVCFSLIRLLVAFAVYQLAAGHSGFVRSVYTEKVFPVITSPMKFLASLVPFSVGEVLLIALAVLAVSGLVFCFARWIYLGVRKKKGTKGFLRLLAVVLTVGILVGGNFFVYGALNYRSLTFKEVTGIEVTPAKTDELEQLCLYLGRKATEARSVLTENDEGVICDARSDYDILKASTKGFATASKEFSCLSGYLVAPKPAIFSDMMSYEQIAGIFPIVYTESIVNVNAPVYDTPFTACHELAHQLGFAQEDEANFIGFIAAIANDDPLYVYSGYYNGFSYAMNKLHSFDEEKWAAVWSDPDIDSEGISRDMRHANAIWDAYKKKAPVISRISEAVNDSYLKANDIKDGTYSYGRMVDLMLAYYRGTLPAAVSGFED
ncbi:MAG: DUF3810 domain-containing protein [Clostridia bacterium]|nr:DUF3810 domain-containing protein [Clostridia bacterium]